MSNWISVEQRLPEVEEEYNYSEVVLVTVLSTHHWATEKEFRYVTTAQLTHNGVWIDNEYMIESSRGTKVIGWMPMPEPMKEVE